MAVGSRLGLGLGLGIELGLGLGLRYRGGGGGGRNVTNDQPRAHYTVPLLSIRDVIAAQRETPTAVKYLQRR